MADNFVESVVEAHDLELNDGKHARFFKQIKTRLVPCFPSHQIDQIMQQHQLELIAF